MAAKKKVVKKTAKPKTKVKSKTAAKPSKGKKDKFSFNYEEVKNSGEWKSDWDDDANDFEGESTEY